MPAERDYVQDWGRKRKRSEDKQEHSEYRLVYTGRCKQKQQIRDQGRILGIGEANVESTDYAQKEELAFVIF